VNVTTFAFAQLLRVLPRTRITRAVGKLCDMRLPPPVSRAVVGAFARAYNVDLNEAAPLNGRGAYPSFDSFFTRSLCKGARRCNVDPAAVVSPADGVLTAVGTVTHGSSPDGSSRTHGSSPDGSSRDEGVIVVKGRPYRACDLLASDAAAVRYRGGQFAVVYLSPRDYHRVHAPVSGRVTEVRSCPGDLFPVNSVSEQHIPDFLVRNRRVAIELESEDCGTVTVVMVAAMIVGRITVSGFEARDVPFGTHRLNPPRVVERGDELGIFHLGSTAVLFLEPGAAPSFDRPPGPVRIGQTMTMADGEASSVHGYSEGAHG